MFFSLVFSVDENVIEVHDNKDVEFLRQDLVDVTLKHCCGVGQVKRNNLVLEMAVTGLADRLSFVAFPDPYLMIGIG